MKIQTLLGIDGCSLIVCQGSGNLYHFSIVDRNSNTYNFEGIYETLQTAIERGKSIVDNINSLEMA